jgi:proteasome assembly chaperone 2
VITKMKLINSNEDLPLAGSTLVLPAVSIGNVGQLAIDLMIETSQALRAGRFVDENILPCGGSGSYSHIPGPAYSLELFTLPNTSATSNTFILQQRAPVAPGLQQAFADALVGWGQSNGVAKFIILGSLDGSFRRDDQLQGPQLRYWVASNNEELVKFCSETAGLRCLEEEWFADKPLEERLTPPWPVVKACENAKVPCAAILAFVLEGENIPDAVDVANAAVKVVPALGAGAGGGEGWKQPPSWKYAFGGARPLGM